MWSLCCEDWRCSGIRQACELYVVLSFPGMTDDLGSHIQVPYISAGCSLIVLQEMLTAEWQNCTELHLCLKSSPQSLCSPGRQEDGGLLMPCWRGGTRQFPHCPTEFFSEELQPWGISLIDSRKIWITWSPGVLAYIYLQLQKWLRLVLHDIPCSTNRKSETKASQTCCEMTPRINYSA